jgi:hypothetical protein
MRRTTLRSSGWTALAWSRTMTRPLATATTSTWLAQAQARAQPHNAIRAQAVRRGSGCTGVCCRRSASGRKSVSQPR